MEGWAVVILGMRWVVTRRRNNRDFREVGL
jgi:hypothetical protein